MLGGGGGGGRGKRRGEETKKGREAVVKGEEKAKEKEIRGK